MDIKTINDMILSLKKIINEPAKINIPLMDNATKIESKSSLFYFWVEVNRKGRLKKRYTLQLMEKQHRDKVLLRLDLVGPPHQNPPVAYELADQTNPCPHLHMAHPEDGDSI